MSEIYVRVEQRQVLARIEQAQPVAIIPIGAQGPRGLPGLPGGSSVEVTAGETISSGRAVIMDGGKAYLFQPGTPAHVGRAYGISASSGVLNGSVTVQIVGEITDASFFTFTADTALWVWANGEIKNTLPTGVATIQKAGIATGNRKMKIDLTFTAIKDI